MSIRNLEKINMKRLFGLIIIFIFLVGCIKMIVDDNLAVLSLVLLFILMLATSSELKHLSRIFGSTG
jgi:predicted membrane protein